MTFGNRKLAEQVEQAVVTDEIPCSTAALSPAPLTRRVDPSASDLRHERKL